VRNSDLVAPRYREPAASLARQIADEDGAAVIPARIERLAASGEDGVPDHRICVPELTDVKNPKPAPNGYARTDGSQRL
jgi:hypothetical protein